MHRPADQVTTAKLKAQAALERYGADAAVSSEGAFGPDPVTGLISQGQEIIYFLKKDWPEGVFVCHRTYDTNFVSESVASEEDVRLFLKKVDFPNTGVTIRASKEGRVIEKDFQTEQEVIDCVRARLHRLFVTSVFIQTDMRAMRNSVRMASIGTACDKLVLRLAAVCPSCHRGGFGEQTSVPGLPCSWCGLPTDAIRQMEYACPHCKHSRSVLCVGTCDPMWCNRCNP